MIRLVPRHLPQIHEIARASFPDPWDQKALGFFLESPSGHCFGVSWQEGAAGEETLVAYVLALLVQGDLDIASVATHPRARRLGVSERLVDFTLGQPGVKRAFLEVDAGNTAALGLYEKLGFTATGKRKGYYGGQRDAILMARGAGSRKPGG